MRASLCLSAFLLLPMLLVAGETARPPALAAAVLFPLREAVLSSEVNAVVATVHKKQGETFVAGDPLISFDKEQYEANVAKARVERDAAREAYQALEKLFAGDSVSRSELMEARKELALAEVNLDLAEISLRRCEIVAPFAGRVVATQIHEHEWVSRGSPLLSIMDDSVVRARFLLPSRLLPKVEIGQPMVIALRDLPGRSAKGTITQISGMVDSASATVEVYADIPNSDQSLRPGMVGQVPLTSWEGMPAHDES